jgi:hypothetical protein
MRQKNSTVRLPRILRQSTKHFKSKIMRGFFPRPKLDLRGAWRNSSPPASSVSPFRPWIFRLARGPAIPRAEANLSLALRLNCGHTFARSGVPALAHLTVDDVPARN